MSKTTDPKPAKGAPTREKRRWIERQICARIEDRREFTTMEFRDLGSVNMVRARLRSLARRGEIVRIANDRWVCGRTLTEQQMHTVRMSAAVRKGCKARQRARRRRSAPVTTLVASELSPEERSRYALGSPARSYAADLDETPAQSQARARREHQEWVRRTEAA